jgi:hypothetical protein
VLPAVPADSVSTELSAAESTGWELAVTPLSVAAEALSVRAAFGDEQASDMTPTTIRATPAGRPRRMRLAQ